MGRHLCTTNQSLCIRQDDRIVKDDANIKYSVLSGISDKIREKNHGWGSTRSRTGSKRTRPDRALHRVSRFFVFPCQFA